MAWLWMLLLVFGVRNSLGFSLALGFRRQPIPLATLHRFGGSSLFPCDGFLRRNQRDCLSMAPSSTHDSDRDLLWLSGKNSRGLDYRLAYQHLLPSPNTIEEDKDENAPAIAVLLCNGFRSVVTNGTKVLALQDHCRKRGWEFCAFDYRGHGLSSGNFEDCTLTDWIGDASAILDRVLLRQEEQGAMEEGKDDGKEKRVILVGSSMGAWIAMHLALKYNQSAVQKHLPNGSKPMFRPIAGILGIAAAPDFLQDLYSSSTMQQQTEWRTQGVAHFPSRYGDPYPISWSLVQDAADHWGLLPSSSSSTQDVTIPGIEPPVKRPAATPLSVGCPVRLLHGKCDEDVSWRKSHELSNLLKASSGSSSKNNNNSNNNNSSNDNSVILTLIEDGDHRLSRPQDIELLLETLDDLVSLSR